MLELRTLTDDDMPALRHIDDLAFVSTTSDERWQVARDVLERDRQLGAFVDGELAGQTAAFTLEMTVPGGQVPTAGVTWVMVSPTNRRQGVLTQLMRRQIDDLHENGEPVAALWSAESAIYGRFGFGVASRMLSVDLPRDVQLGGPGPGQGLSVRIGEVPDLLSSCVAVYEAVRPTLPGMVTRSPAAWRETSLDIPAERGKSSALRCALVSSSGGPQGYAWFRTTSNWEGGIPHGKVEVVEMIAATRQAMRQLLDLVTGLDLTSECHAWNLPVDHDVVTLTWHTHRLRQTVSDQLWVRLIRLDEALASRAYAADVDVVLDVTDEWCPWNSGRWRLAASATGAAVERTNAPADVSLDVRNLAAGYLGDDMIGPAHRVGLITEHTRGAVSAVARSMRGDRAPWCGYMF